MACGTPVVALNASSIPEVVGDAALTFDPRDATALAAHLRALLSDAALRAELRRRGFARAAMFSWERTARSVLGIYARLLGGEG